MSQHKKCSKCGEAKPVGQFPKNRTKKCGLASQCKDCTNANARRYRKENPEAVRESLRQYYDRNREAVLERRRRYHDENRDGIVEKKRQRYAENRESMCESSRRYYNENREAALERRRRYRKENWEALRECDRRYLNEKQGISREVATRNGMPWTEAEDKFLLSTDMTNLEAAVELGRTAGSVSGRKRRLRKNLQTI